MEFNTTKEVYDYLRSYQNKLLDREDYENRMGGLKAITYSQEAPGAPMTSTNKLNYFMEKIQEIDDYLEGIERFIDEEFTGSSKQILRLRFIKGMSVLEVADLLNLSESGAESRTGAAIKKYINGKKREEKV